MKKLLTFLCLLPLLSGCVTLMEKEELKLEYEKLNLERAKMGLSPVEVPQVLANKPAAPASYIDKANERADDRKVMMRNRRAK